MMFESKSQVRSLALCAKIDECAKLLKPGADLHKMQVGALRIFPYEVMNSDFYYACGRYSEENYPYNNEIIFSDALKGIYDASPILWSYYDLFLPMELQTYEEYKNILREENYNWKYGLDFLFDRFPRVRSNACHALLYIEGSRYQLNGLFGTRKTNKINVNPIEFTLHATVYEAKFEVVDAFNNKVLDRVSITIQRIYEINR